ncbi:MAG: hypothetical protein EZS28_034221, partial [Streblomastix strix]
SPRWLSDGDLKLLSRIFDWQNGWITGGIDY